MNLAQKTFKIGSLIIFGMICTALTYKFSTDALPSYNLDHPDERLQLPEILREVSGITDVDINTLALVQDENGIVFIYDLEKNKIKRQFEFAEDGDYEGITRVGKTLYILRSDGTLFEIEDYEKESLQVTAYDTGILAKNNEGLCYDPVYNRLLIANKSKAGKGKEYKGIKAVFSFDLETKTTSEHPVYEFSLQAINRFVADNEIELPIRTTKKGKQVPTPEFKPSAIAIHPITNQLYMLSAADHLILIFNIKGGIETVQVLDEFMFNKPEGITFFENGDMIISNEGPRDGQGTLLRFDYPKNQ